MPTDHKLLLAAFVSFVVAIPMLGLRINFVALGLALMTLALYLR
jgi:hypothetical protein